MKQPVNPKSNQINEPSIKDEYNLLKPLLHSIYSEMKVMSSRKQDGILNESKVTVINKILSRIKVLLKKEPTNDFLELLDLESLPSNSDAVLILVQFESAIEQFRRKNGF